MITQVLNWNYLSEVIALFAVSRNSWEQLKYLASNFLGTTETMYATIVSVLPWYWDQNFTQHSVWHLPGPIVPVIQAPSSSLGMETEDGQGHRLGLARAHFRLEPGLTVASLGQSLTVIRLMWRLRPWAGLRSQGKTVLAQDHGKSIVAVWALNLPSLLRSFYRNDHMVHLNVAVGIYTALPALNWHVLMSSG